jgi:hypothetical protein
MAVGFVASATSGIQTSVASFSIGTLGTGARAGIVFVCTFGSSTPKDTGVTWNGTAMTLLYSAIDTDTEPGCVRAYFLDNVTNGTITVSRTNDAVAVVGYAASISAATATEVAQVITRVSSTQNTNADTSTTGTGASGEIAVDDGGRPADSMRFAAFYSGAATPPSNGTNSTALQVLDATSYGSRFVRETTAGTGSRSVGAATGTTDDWAIVAVAVSEKTKVITPGLIDGAPAIYSLTVIPDQFVTLGLIDAASAIYSPTVVGVASLTGYAKVISDDSPTVYLRLGEASGTAADNLGSGGATYDGTYINTPTLGVVGALTGDADTGVEFNGSSQRVSVPDGSATDIGDFPWSIEAWAKRDVTGVFHCISDKGVGMPWFGVSDTNKLSLYVNSGPKVVEQTGTFPTDAYYHHCVVTFDGTTAKLYIDGADVSGTTTDSTFTNNASVLGVGANFAGTAEWWNGKLDEYALYKSVLSAAQVYKHYRSGTSAYEAAVIADGATFLAPLDEASGTPIDIVGGLTGTAYGSPTYAVSGPVVGHTGVAFPTSSDYFSFPDDTALDLAGSDITIEVWFARDTDRADWQGILAKNFAWGVSIDPGDYPSMTVPGTSQLSYSSPAFPTDSVWKHMVFRRRTIPASTSDLTHTINGVAQTMPYVNLVKGALADNSNVLHVGIDTADGVPYNNSLGRIAYVAVYKSWLTDAQIANHYELRSKYAAEVLADGATFVLPMGEASGNLKDIVGGKTATASGTPTYGVTGPTDGRTAININASGDFSVSDHVDLDIGDGPYTVEMWVKRNNTAAAGGYILGKTDASLATTGYTVEFNNGSPDTVRLQDGSTSTHVRSTTDLLADTNWHHVAFTRALATNAIVYVDGAADTTVSGAKTFSDNALSLVIGALYSGASRFEGQLAFVAIYKSALPAGRILAHYNAGKSTAQTVTLGLIDAASAIYAPTLIKAAYPITLGLIDGAAGAGGAAHVQSLGTVTNSDASQTTTVLSPTSKTVAVGNTIVVGWGAILHAAATGVTDNLGNTYSLVEAKSGSLNRAEVWSAPVTTGGSLTTITVSHGSSQYIYAIAEEISGAAAPPAAAGGSYVASSATATWMASGTIPAGGLVIGFEFNNNDRTPTAGAASGSPSTSITLLTNFGDSKASTAYAASATQVTSFVGTTNLGAATGNAGAGAIFSPSATRIFALTVTASQSAAVGLIDSGSAIYAPTLVAKSTLTPGLIDAGAAIYAPTVVHQALPIVEGTSSGVDASSTTNHVFNLPSGVQAGDLIFFVATANNSSGTVTPPSGWLPNTDDTDPSYLGYGGSMIVLSYYKIAAGGETTVSFTTSSAMRYAYVAYRISGVWDGYAGDPASPLLLWAGTSYPYSSGTSTNPDPPSTSWPADRDTAWIAFAFSLSTNVASAAPSGYSGLVTSPALADAETISAAHKVVRRSTSEDPGVFTMATSFWNAYTIGVRGKYYGADGVALGLIPDGPSKVIYALTVTKVPLQITPGLIDSGSAIYAPTVVATQILAPGLIDSGSAIYSLTVAAKWLIALQPIDGLSRLFDGFSYPRDIAITPNGAYAYVADNIAGTVIVWRLSDDTLYATITGLPGCQSLEVTPSGTYVYVSAGSLKRITVSTNTVTATIATSGSPMRIAINSTSTRAYVSDYASSGKLDVINLSTDALLTTVTGVGGYPQAVAITPDDAYVYVAHNAGVTKIRTSDNTIVGSITGLPTYCVGLKVTPDGTKVIVSSGDKVYICSVSTDTILNTVTLTGLGYPAATYFLDLSKDGTRAYLGTYNSGIAIIDIASATHTGFLPVGRTFDLAVTPDDSRIYSILLGTGLGLSALRRTDPYFTGIYPLGLKYTQILTPGLIDAGSAIYAPTATMPFQPVTLGLIDNGAAIYAPTIVPGPVAATLGLIDSTSAIYAPTLTAKNTLTVGLIDASPAIYAPTLTPKNTLSIGLITSVSAIYAPVVGFSLGLPLIDAVKAIYSPTLTPKNTLTIGAIESTPAIYSLTLVKAAYPITLGLIDSGSAIYAPTVVGGGVVNVFPALIDSGSAIYALQVQPDQFLTVGLIDGGAAIFALTLTAKNALIVGLIDNAPAIYAITSSAYSTLIVGAIERTSEIYAPTLVVGPATVTLGVVGNNPSVYALDTSGAQVIALAAIQQATEIYAPTLAAGPVGITLDLIDTGAALYAPTLSPVVTISLIDAGSAIYDLTAVLVTVTHLDLIDAGNEVYAPVLIVSVDLTLIGDGPWVWPFLAYNEGEVEGYSDVAFTWSQAADGFTPITGSAGSEFNWRTEGVGTFAATFGAGASSFGWTTSGAGEERVTGAGSSSFGWSHQSSAYVTHPSDSSFTFATAGSGAVPIIGEASSEFIWLPFAAGSAGYSGTGASSFGWTASGAGVAGASGTGASSFGWTTGTGEGAVAEAVTGTADSSFNWQDSTGVGWHVEDDSVIGYSDAAFGWEIVTITAVVPGAGYVIGRTGDTTWVLITS